MPYDPAHHHRQSIRLRGYDYAADAGYFVTLVANGRHCIFGAIADDRVLLNEVGILVAACWCAIPRHFSRAVLDAYVIMPNHLHGIIILEGQRPPAVQPPRAAPVRRDAPRGTTAQSLGAIVQNFKSVSARALNRRRDARGEPLWQRNYYEHVIRDHSDLDRLRRYIADNPTQWAIDSENQERNGGS